MTDDLQRRLEALGRIESPQLGDDRVDAIGDRVMAATSRPAPIGGRRRTMALGIAAVLVALLIAGVVLATTRGADDASLELADGVTLELPDAAPARGNVGDALPDGTVVTVADGGVAGVDGRRFGPGRYLVVGGEFVPLDPETATASTTTTTTRPTTTIATTTTVRPTRQPDGAVPAPSTVAPPNRTTTVPSSDPVVRPPIDGTRPPSPTTTGPTTTADRPTTTRPATSTTTLPDRTTTTIQRTTTTAPRDRPTTSPPTTSRDQPASDRP